MNNYLLYSDLHNQMHSGHGYGNGNGYANSPASDPAKNESSIKTEILKNTFYITYIFLLTTGTITFIESLRTSSPSIRHIMNIETCISIVAAYFYSQFIDILKASEANKDKEIPYAAINITRYTDWMISTPLMLFVLCMVLGSEKKIPFTFSIFFIVLLLNIGMLVSGYLGEINKIDKILALFVGFALFFAMYIFIWMVFMSSGKNSFGANLSYFAFLIVWSIYGIVYMMDEENKNIVYNILDLIAKAFIGIFFWMYFTKAIIF